MASSKGIRGIPSLRKRISSEEDQTRLISSTPEGEKYFQKQAEVLYEKAAKGEPLEVEEIEAVVDEDAGVPWRQGLGAEEPTFRLLAARFL